MKPSGGGAMKVQIRLLVLQESEIRKAAALLARFHEVASREPDAPESEYAAAAYDAINAATIALHGADDEQRVLILSATEVIRKALDGADEQAAQDTYRAGNA